MALPVVCLQSFQDLEDWLALVRKVYTPDAMPQVALIGNKADLTHMRAVHLSKHNEFAGAHSMYRCRWLTPVPC